MATNHSTSRSDRQAQQGSQSKIGAYFLNHAQVFFSSLGRIYRAPLSNLMTIAVIAIALALPTGLLVLLNNLENLSGGWDGSTQISVFTRLDVSDADASDMAQKLRLWPEIKTVNMLTRKDAMEEFRALSGFGEALDVLQENPLPAVLVINPNPIFGTPEKVQVLLKKLQAHPGIDLVQLDMQWVKRLYTMMEIGKRGIIIIACFLALAVLLTVGNTIRLDIQNRRDEIVVIKLIGGTNAFIRRPFLYTGFWYGILGGILSWIMIESSLGLLSEPVQRLAGLYGSNFSLASLDLLNTASLLGFSTLLGLVGSWLAVGRHLHEIEPG
jgi:cell division transport system permease protein